MIRIEDSVYNHYENTSRNSCSLSVEDITYYQFHTGLEFRNRFLNQYLLIYPAKGDFHLLIDNEKITLQEKELLLISPYRFIRGIPESADNNKETILYTVEFHCDVFYFFELNQYLQVRNAEAVEPLIAELYTEQKNMEAYTFYHDARLLLILNTVKRLVSGFSEQRQLAEKIRSYIIHHIMQPLTVTEISEVLKYNKDYLCRIFKKEYGTSIKEFINKEKIVLSKRLLQTSDLSVNAISQMLGWEDVNLFFKYFKYHEQTTPTKYRQNTVR